MSCNAKLFLGDCIDVMHQLIDEGIKVDAIITDLSYGTTPCPWDIIIPFEKLFGINKAFDIIDKGILEGKTFLVYADVDCDGVSSGAIGSQSSSFSSSSSSSIPHNFSVILATLSHICQTLKKSLTLRIPQINAAITRRI